MIDKTDPIFLTDINLLPKKNFFNKKITFIEVYNKNTRLRHSFNEKDKEFDYENSCQCCGVDLVRYKFFTETPMKHLLCPSCDEELDNRFNKRDSHNDYFRPFNIRPIESMESFIEKRRNETLSVFIKANRVDLMNKIRIENLKEVICK